MANECHCLCRMNHPEQPDLCVGTEDVRIAYERLAGRIDVAFCYPCAAATLASRPESEPAKGRGGPHR